MMTEWEFESATGYYYNQRNGCYYDPNSGFYYTDALGKMTYKWIFLGSLKLFLTQTKLPWWIGTGKWVTQEEALAASQVSSDSIKRKPIFKKPSSATEAGPASQSGAPSEQLVSRSVNPMKKSVKGAPSSLTVNKRKRKDEKPKVVSEEEASALKAREAARKRVEAREKPLLGLYRH